MVFMPYHPFDTCFEYLPEIIPIFPLSGALLLPRGELPLNIFEPRYLAMVSDSLKGNRLIGIIQPDYKTGCVGRIIKFEETIDGRYMISLRGLCRFQLGLYTIQSSLTYRKAQVNWTGFNQDMIQLETLDIDKVKLKSLLKTYFETQGLSMDWDLIDDVADEGLLTALAMICPLQPTDKQALLEAKCFQTRANLFIKLLEMSLQSSNSFSSTPH